MLVGNYPKKLNKLLITPEKNPEGLGLWLYMFG